MNFLLLLFSNVITGAVASISIHGAETQVENNNRRHLLKDSTCTLFKKCISYPPTKEHPKGYDKHSWVCKLSSEDSSRFNTKYVNIDDESFARTRISNAVSGTSTLIMSEAYIAMNEPQLFVPNSARIELGTVHKDDRDRTNQRRLTARTGTLRTLVIRVSDKNNRVPDFSLDDLKNDVFDDAVCLKTQIETCSYRKLKIEPFVGFTPNNVYVDNGVIDVKMDYDVYSAEGDIGFEAETAAWNFLGDLDDPMFGLILFSLPSGRKRFGAYAYLGGKSSFYDNETIGYSAVQVHEIGHNLGLDHSGEFRQTEYGDGTGVMGIAPYGDDIRVCFNAEKNYDLGWYSDQVESINPIDGTGSRSFVLNGVIDYQKNKDALIVLRLEQTESGQDYYIGYNKVEGMHADAAEDRDKVIIIRKDDYWLVSTKLGALTPGEDFVFDNFNGSNSVTIRYVGGNNRNARIEVIDNGPSPIRCKEFIVEFTADSPYQDYSWAIIDAAGSVVAEQPAFVYANMKYSQRVCLPMGDSPQTYKFIVNDRNGDGVCCDNGFGIYKVLNDEYTEIVNSDYRDEDFFAKEYDIEVPAQDEIPTCQKFTIKFSTNAHPEDNSWFITNAEGTVVAERLSFQDPWEDYINRVCLPMDNDPQVYKFTVTDKFGDGICCEYGNGIYTVTDGIGEEVFSSDFKYEGFYSQENDMKVPGLATPPTPSPIIPTAPPVATVRPTRRPTRRPRKGGKNKGMKKSGRGMRGMRGMRG